jgi:hypothetical protein
MIDLLLEGWCEPPRRKALHLSTLVHQVLSVIAERGGASASRLYHDLCRTGPFRMVTTATPELLAQDALSTRLDAEALPDLCSELVKRK